MAILNARALNGVFRICFNNATGTAFIFYSQQGAVLATAAHVLKGIQPGDNVLFQRDSCWHSLAVGEVLFDSDGYDVCVFSSMDLVLSNLNEPLKEAMTALGEPLAFLGFPHGLTNTYPGQGFPMPLVRRAHFSGVVELDGLAIPILDGFNNPGYSGGPIFHVDPSGEPKFFGTVSGYRFESSTHSAVYRTDEHGNATAIPDTFVRPNSGMIYTVGSGRLVALAKSASQFLPVHSSN